MYFLFLSKRKNLVFVAFDCSWSLTLSLTCITRYGSLLSYLPEFDDHFLSLKTSLMSWFFIVRFELTRNTWIYGWGFWGLVLARNVGLVQYVDKLQLGLIGCLKFVRNGQFKDLEAFSSVLDWRYHRSSWINEFLICSNHFDGSTQIKLDWWAFLFSSYFGDLVHVKLSITLLFLIRNTSMFLS